MSKSFFLLCCFSESMLDQIIKQTKHNVLRLRFVVQSSRRSIIKKIKCPLLWLVADKRLGYILSFIN